METEARTCCEEFILSIFANISDCRFLAKSRLKERLLYNSVHVCQVFITSSTQRKISVGIFKQVGCAADSNIFSLLFA